MRQFFLQISFLILSSLTLLGQNSKYGKVLLTQNAPPYTQFKKNYTLSKITYYEKRVVIDLKLVFCRASTSWTRSVAFMPPDNINAWCLKDPKSKKVFKLLEIRNIKRNGIDLKTRVRSPKEKLYIEMDLQGPSTETFTCQVHFPRLPKEIQLVDLLEGPDSKFIEGHWNFFDIKINHFGKDNQLLPNKERHKPTPISTIEELETPSPEFGLRPPKKENVKSNNAQEYPNLSSIRDIDCNKMLVLGKIIFQDNSIKFQNQIDAERALFMLSTYLKQNTGSKIQLFGHTDIFGTPDRNLELSQQRVERLQQWFIQQKISSNRILTQALGSTTPIYPDGNARNRRVEVKIVCTTK